MKKEFIARPVPIYVPDISSIKGHRDACSAGTGSPFSSDAIARLWTTASVVELLRRMKISLHRILKWSFGSFFCTALLSIIAVSGGNCVDYYVSPGGLDTNAGTIGAPFQTIAKARDVVRTVNTSMSADINVYLRGGWHVQTTALIFNQSDSGTNGHNVIYRAYSGEYPVISGGRQITGWTLHDAGKNIWKASAPGLNTRQLYVNCIRAVRAHSGSGLPGAVKNASGYTTTDADMQNWGNKSDIEFVYNALQGGISGAYWLEERCGVASISGYEITMKQPGWANCTKDWGQGPLNPTDIENAYELLDQQGEWYLNRSQGMVYYIPRTGENMATAVVIAPVLETLVSGAGVLGTPIRNIQFKGITFAHATWLRPSGNDGFPEIQANYCNYPNDTSGSRWPGGNIVFKIAQSLRFERCMFKHLGGEGLELSGGSQNCVVTGCVFTDISADCIRIGDATDPARSDTRTRDSGNQITNCYIHDAPCEYHGGPGIIAGYVSDILISHNEIGYVPYSGISCGWGWGTNSYAQNNQLNYNYIHNIAMYVSDGGCIYTLSSQPGTVQSYNWFDSLPSISFAESVYPDEGSADMEIHHIVCSNIPKWLHVWTSTIHNINIHDIWTTTSNSLNNGTNVTVSNVTLISGSKSNWPQAAQDIANNAGIESSYIDIKTAQCGCSYGNPGPVTDTTAPSNITTVSDGTGTDINSAFSTTQLSANWTASTDAESGIAGYKYAIGTAQGATNITNGWITNGTNLTVTKTGLTLTTGTTYYFSVKAVNGAGLESASAKNSNGQLVEASNNIALGKQVNVSSTETGSNVASNAVDGNTGTRWSSAYSDPQWIYVDLGQTYAVSEVILNWEAAYAIGYKIQVSQNATDWTDVYTAANGDGGTDDISFTATGGRYVRMYGTQRAIVYAGYSLWEFEVYGNGAQDTTPPGAPVVRDGAIQGSDIASTISSTTLSANWNAATDNESGITSYQYAIGTSAGGTQTMNWATLGNVTAVTKSGLTLAEGTTYYFSVRAINGNSLTGSAGNSNGQFVIAINTGDTTPPSNIVQVRDGTGADVDSISPGAGLITQLSANWDNSADSESGISRYYFAIGTLPGATDITNWTDNGQLTSVTKTGISLTVGTTYYFSVKAENGVGLQSSVTNSDGQLVLSMDSQGPLISNVTAQGITGSGVTITWETDEPSTSQVEYGLSASYGSLTGEYISMDTAHSVALAGLEAKTQYHYRVISRDGSGNESLSADFTFTTAAVQFPSSEITAYPNPYDLSSPGGMKFNVGSGAASELRIYTLGGKLVSKLSSQFGTSEISWDGRNEDGQAVARGIYLYSIVHGSDKTTGKFAVTRPAR